MSSGVFLAVFPTTVLTQNVKCRVLAVNTPSFQPLINQSNTERSYITRVQVQ